MRLELSVIVVTYNCAPFINNFLNELQSSFAGFDDVEILIQDNNSTDNTFMIMKKCLASMKEGDPEIKVFAGENVGFAKANNILLTKAKFKNILFLNPDVFGFTSEFWNLLFDYWDKQNPYFIKLLNVDGSFQCSTSEFISAKRMIKSVMGKAEDYEKISRPIEIDAGIMAFLLVTKQMIEKVGKVSEQYFMYSEDIDWCYRAIKQGFRNIYDPRLSLYHIGGASSETLWKKQQVQILKYEAEGKFIQQHYRGLNKFFLLGVNYFKILLSKAKKKKYANQSKINPV